MSNFSSEVAFEYGKRPEVAPTAAALAQNLRKLNASSFICWRPSLVTLLNHFADNLATAEALCAEVAHIFKQLPEQHLTVIYPTEGTPSVHVHERNRRKRAVSLPLAVFE